MLFTYGVQEIRLHAFEWLLKLKPKVVGLEPGFPLPFADQPLDGRHRLGILLFRPDGLTDLAQQLGNRPIGMVPRQFQLAW